jgi:hypothetical protein
VETGYNLAETSKNGCFDNDVVERNLYFKISLTKSKEGRWGRPF